MPTNKNEVMEMQVYYLNLARDMIEIRQMSIDTQQKYLHRLWYGWMLATLGGFIMTMIFSFFSTSTCS